MDDIINYTMENPGNTNPNILRSMLENYDGNSSGYTITETVYHENKNAEFVNNTYTFAGIELPISVMIEINGVPSDNMVTVDAEKTTYCGGYNIALVYRESLTSPDEECVLTATPATEMGLPLTNASVKIYRKNVEVTDDFVSAVAKAMEIINGSVESEGQA